MKKGYILPYGTAKQIGRLIALSGPDAVVDLLEALEAYSLDGSEPQDLDLAAEIIFEGMRADLDRDREKYEAMVEQRKAAAASRWNKDDAKACGRIRTDADIDSRQETVDRRQETEIVDSVVCAEPVIGLPLNSGDDYMVSTDEVTEYSQLYPAVNVMQELRNMRGWLISNPTRRKTKRGIKAFITSWLSREQDRPTARSGTTKLTADEIWNLPTISPWTEDAAQ